MHHWLQKETLSSLHVHVINSVEECFFFVRPYVVGAVSAETCETDINTEHYYVQCLNSTSFTVTVQNVSVQNREDIWQCLAAPEAENDPGIFSNCVTVQVKGKK